MPPGPVTTERHRPTTVGHYGSWQPCNAPELDVGGSDLGVSFSGLGGVVVFVDDTAEYSVASDTPVDRYGDGPPVVVGSVLASGLVGPMIVVVPRILRQNLGCVAVVVDQDSIGALSADGAHEPFGITIGSWGFRRCLDDRDVLAGEHPVECRRELGVSVTDEEAEQGDPAC